MTGLIRESFHISVMDGLNHIAKVSKFPADVVINNIIDYFVGLAENLVPLWEIADIKSPSKFG